MPGPILPAVIAGGAAAARGARSLYKAGKAVTPAIRKEIKDFNEYMPGMLPYTAAATTFVTSDANEKTEELLKKRPNTIVRGRSSNPSAFSRKLIK